MRRIPQFVTSQYLPLASDDYLCVQALPARTYCLSRLPTWTGAGKSPFYPMCWPSSQDQAKVTSLGFTTFPSTAETHSCGDGSRPAFKQVRWVRRLFAAQRK